MKHSYFPQPAVESSQSHFAKAPTAQINRSTFDRSSNLKTTFNGNVLVPVFLDEVLPGDTFDMKSTMFARLATPLKPVMDNIYMDVHFWFVPNRLVWDDWERFMGERTTPTDDITTITVPEATIQTDAPGAGPFDESIAAYMGISQVPTSFQYTVSALPFRAYRLIWNEHYRDQNLQDPIPVNTTSTGDGGEYSLAGPQRRGKRHDYFTSCLPFRQKGDPVGIPLGDSAPITGIGVTSTPTGVNVAAFETGNPDLVTYASAHQSDVTTAQNNGAIVVEGDPGDVAKPNIYADLTQATSVTVSDLRTAFQIQKLLERDARSGSRYIELVLAHFGTRSDDARLQRPEFLGGATNRVNINPIANTVGSDNQGTLLPQGELAAYGTGLNECKWSKSFTEHGHIIGLVSARADLTYQQGTERMWFRRTRYDFYWPSLAHLSEQAVLSREIYANGAPEDEEVFGYQEVFGEYRYKPSRITGRFASEYSASLDVWHLSEQFEGRPALNDVFIQNSSPFDRIEAVPSEPDFILDAWFDLKCTRPMPIYAVPGLIDHF